MFFKQKVQALNRITIPGAIMESLDMHQGDMIYLTSDGERIYLSPEKEKIPRLMAVFERGTGTIITRGSYKPLTDTKFKPMTNTTYKKITDKEILDSIKIQEEQ